MTHPIVQTARRQLGARFHHQGRLAKAGNHKGGLDCLGLLICVSRELALTNAQGQPLVLFDSIDYSHRPDTAELRRRLEAQLIPIDNREEGAIALFDIDDAPQHLGIISYYENSFGLIHAYAPARAVVEHALDDYWRSNLVALFRVP